jgi:hypothetical protein
MQTCRMQEANEKIQVQRKLERVQESLSEAWPEIRKIAPELPEFIDANKLEHHIEFIQGAWTQLTTQVEQLKT